jgi:hypothetical protein
LCRNELLKHVVAGKIVGSDRKTSYCTSRGNERILEIERESISSTLSGKLTFVRGYGHVARENVE